MALFLLDSLLSHLSQAQPPASETVSDRLCKALPNATVVSPHSQRERVIVITEPRSLEEQLSRYLIDADQNRWPLPMITDDTSFKSDTSVEDQINAAVITKPWHIWVWMVRVMEDLFGAACSYRLNLPSEEESEWVAKLQSWDVIRPAWSMDATLWSELECNAHCTWLTRLFLRPGVSSSKLTMELRWVDGDSRLFRDQVLHRLRKELAGRGVIQANDSLTEAKGEITVLTLGHSPSSDDFDKQMDHFRSVLGAEHCIEGVMDLIIADQKGDSELSSIGQEYSRLIMDDSSKTISLLSGVCAMRKKGAVLSPALAARLRALKKIWSSQRTELRWHGCDYYSRAVVLPCPLIQARCEQLLNSQDDCVGWFINTIGPAGLVPIKESDSLAKLETTFAEFKVQCRRVSIKNTRKDGELAAMLEGLVDRTVEIRVPGKKGDWRMTTLKVHFSSQMPPSEHQGTFVAETEKWNEGAQQWFLSVNLVRQGAV